MDRLPPQLKPWRRGRWVGLIALLLLCLLGWLLVTVALVARGDGIGPCELSVAVGVGVALLVTIGLVLKGRSRPGRASAGLGTNEDGNTLIRQGRYTEAARLFEDLCLESQKSPALHALYVHNHGVALLHSGDVDRAIACLNEALGSGWLDVELAAHRPQVLVSLALAQAVSGDVEAATARRDQAAALLSETRRSATWLVDAIIAARRGEAFPLDDARQREAESTLSPIHVRAIGLLEQFVRSRGGAYRGPPAPRAAAEHKWLGQRWPELEAFLGRLSWPGAPSTRP